MHEASHVFAQRNYNIETDNNYRVGVYPSYLNYNFRLFMSEYKLAEY